MSLPLRSPAPLRLSDLPAPTAALTVAHLVVAQFRAPPDPHAAGVALEQALRRALGSLPGVHLHPPGTRGFGVRPVSASGLGHCFDLVWEVGSALFIAECKAYGPRPIPPAPLLLFSHQILDCALAGGGAGRPIYRVFLTTSPQVRPATRRFAAAGGIGLVDRGVLAPAVAG